MIELPEFLPLRITHRKGRPTGKDIDGLDRLAVVLCGRKPANTLRGMSGGAQIERAAERMLRQKRKNALIALDNRRGTLVSLHVFEGSNAFARLTTARKIVQSWLDPEPSRFGLLCVGADAGEAAIRDIAAAAAARFFRLPTFKSDEKGRSARKTLVIFDDAKPDLDRQMAESEANNLARYLTALPPNVLTAGAYISTVEALAKQNGLEFELFDEPRLAEIGAGAFLAVAQGNASREAGIVRLRYRPEGKAAPAVALVGKGIVFDTGGTNLKPFKSMLDMHIDMEGSAVALATGIALARLAVPFAFDVWLAITPNRISATAYTSQDVVTTASGTTIQVIHTDAEGRMVLADTLTLASREKPGLIIDYATLTGACIGALTPRYSGVFTNRAHANERLVAHGAACGERVWAFPMDDDYDESLKSEVADIKQCAADGSGDHILAARFLGRFVPPSVPWIHMDLSAGQVKGGLGHVPTEITGFGVRYTLTLLLEGHEGPAALAAEMG